MEVAAREDDPLQPHVGVQKGEEQTKPLSRIGPHGRARDARIDHQSRHGSTNSSVRYVGSVAAKVLPSTLANILFSIYHYVIKAIGGMVLP